MADAASISERNVTQQDDSIEINESTKEFHCAADLTGSGIMQVVESCQPEN